MCGQGITKRIQVHDSKTGDNIGCLTEEHFDLQEGDRIDSIGYGNGDILHVYIGVHPEKKRLVAYKVVSCLEVLYKVSYKLLQDHIYCD